MSLLESVSTAVHSVLGLGEVDVDRPVDAARVNQTRGRPELPRVVIVQRGSSDAIEQLLLAVASGDREALVALESRVSGLVCANIRRVLRDGSRCDAVTQEFFAEVLRDASDFDPHRDSAQVWLLTRAHQRALSGLTPDTPQVVEGVSVVDQEKLSSVLSEFARTLATEFPIQQILDHLVEQIVGILPITSAGVTLIDEGREPRYVAASDASALRYERLQSEIGEGPCVVAFDSGEPVAVADLAGEERFPAFATSALAAGLGAVFAFPLHHGDGRLGALDLYRETPGDLDQHTMETAQTLADVAAAYLINAQAREDARVASEHHRQRSLHDALTGLPNRLLLQDRFQHAGQRALRTYDSVAVLFIDLDDFKLVNDTHGHHVGDELLVAVARRLAALVRPHDTLARVSGDEFVFLCENLTDRADAEILVRRIEESFEVPFDLSGLELTLTASVGIAIAGPGEAISDHLLAEADSAMYHAKKKGSSGGHLRGRREFFDLDGSSLDRQVRSALANNEFEVVYQPLVRSTDGLIVGVEALLRWTSATRGAVPPSVIVAVAERSDLISEIGAWVLQRSHADHHRCSAKHPGVTLDLAVNVSVRQLLTPGFVDTIASVLATTDTPPTAVILEVTESVLLDDTGRAQLVLNELR